MPNENLPTETIRQNPETPSGDCGAMTGSRSSETPQSDAEMIRVECSTISERIVKHYVSYDFSCQLERERDAMTERLNTIRDVLCDAMPDTNAPTAETARLLWVQRDALRDALIEMRYAHTDKAERMAEEILGENVKTQAPL